MNAPSPSTMLTRGEQAFAGLLPSLFSWPDQFTPGSRTTLRPFPPPTSDREYTPARSAERHLPDAHCRRLSIRSPAVTATGTTFWAARPSGKSKSDTNLQLLISAPVH